MSSSVSSVLLFSVPLGLAGKLSAPMDWVKSSFPSSPGTSIGSLPRNGVDAGILPHVERVVARIGIGLLGVQQSDADGNSFVVAPDAVLVDGSQVYRDRPQRAADEELDELLARQVFAVVDIRLWMERHERAISIGDSPLGLEVHDEQIVALVDSSSSRCDVAGVGGERNQRASATVVKSNSVSEGSEPTLQARKKRVSRLATSMFSKSLRNTSPCVFGLGWLQASSPRIDTLEGWSVSIPGNASSQRVEGSLAVPDPVHGSDQRAGRLRSQNGPVGQALLVLHHERRVEGCVVADRPRAGRTPQRGRREVEQRGDLERDVDRLVGVAIGETAGVGEDDPSEVVEDLIVGPAGQGLAPIVISSEPSMMFAAPSSISPSARPATGRWPR